MLPALILAILGLAALVAATLVGGRDQGQYLVIGAPWADRAQVLDMILRAEGGVAGFGGLPSVVIAMADRPDFAQALRDQGAWLVLPSPVFLGCSGGTAEVRP